MLRCSMDFVLEIATVIVVSVYSAIGLRLLSPSGLYKSAGLITTPVEMTYLFTIYYAALFITLFGFFRYKPTFHVLSVKEYTALAVSATTICFVVC